jgi:SAM-dependent methyltransferase
VSGVSRDVQAFYEAHPYPPGEADLDGVRRGDGGRRRRADYRLHFPAGEYRQALHLLVAGCGTVQGPRYAMRWPNASVMGIDFSAAAIDQSEALKRRHKLENLELACLPIERVAELDRQFDLIVCTGVLHHLPDPDAGLRALREVLASGGAMTLMVYARYGRAGVYMLQEYCRRLAIGSSAADLRQLAMSLRALPKEHPLMPLLRNSPDFATEAGLADALLNPQDRAYTVPELLALVGRNGLRFGRWVRQAPYLPHCGAPGGTPHHERVARLPLHEQYAAMELFRGTMVRHSAVVHRDDEPHHRHDVGFAGDGWRKWVPIRLPETVCVEERLPPTAVGVLINPAHTYTDIYLPIDAGQKRMIDAIDGRRSVKEIAARAGEREPDAVRTLFERLWWHDQVVFEVPS